MLSKLALLVAGFVMLTATAALATPPAKDEGDSAATITLSQTVSFLPASVQSAFVSKDAKDAVADR